MKKNNQIPSAGFLILTMPTAVSPGAAYADSLSSMLGAMKMDGLSNFANCQNESIGYREGLIADRLELKLANTPNLSQQERQTWLADIAVLRQVQQTHKPDRSNSQHYLLGLTDKEQVAINSQNTRFVQEIHLKCEQQYGGMTRYSSNADHSGQIQYENQLRAQMRQPLSLEAIPAEPLPSTVQKTAAQTQQERKAEYQAMQQAAMQKFNQCAAGNKGLRPRLVAQVLQRKLESSPTLSAKERAEIQADIQAARASAGKGLGLIESADPKNPYRAEQRLSAQEQMGLNNEYAAQYSQAVLGCAGAARPLPNTF